MKSSRWWTLHFPYTVYNCNNSNTFQKYSIGIQRRRPGNRYRVIIASLLSQKNGTFSLYAASTNAKHGACPSVACWRYPPIGIIVKSLFPFQEIWKINPCNLQKLYYPFEMLLSVVSCYTGMSSRSSSILKNALKY